MKNGDEYVLPLDSVEEALLGALARSNGVSPNEQLRRMVSALLDEAARNTMKPCNKPKN